MTTKSYTMQIQENASAVMFGVGHIEVHYEIDAQGEVRRTSPPPTPKWDGDGCICEEG